MPQRSIFFVNGGVYHIYNKTLDHKKIFQSEKLCNLFLEICTYYRSSKAKISFSHLKLLTPAQKTDILSTIRYKKYFYIDILGYVIMPNHFHLILKQKKDKGILKFMSCAMNSFTRYFNVSTERKGPIFLPRFKAKLINKDDQLKHISRYIHLNPYSSGLINKIEDIPKYPHSSYNEYLKDSNSKLIETKYVLELFNNNKKNYEKFVLQNADYQKTLEYAKHTNNFFNR